MKQIFYRVTDFVYDTTATTKFFVATVSLLVFQSTWLAFTAIYPLPFDEYVHVGFMRVYAGQWLPFITQQPPEASLFGDITRTNSYLYHYLMSFPYRVIDLFTDNEMVLVISLRLINIALVVAALLLFRKLFIMWKIPRRVMNVMFLMLVLTPIVPFVAAHVNYDNLIILVTPIVLIFGTRLIINKGDMAWNGTLYAVFGLAGTLAKETFGPLFVVISLYVAWRLWHEHGAKFLVDLQKSFIKNIRHVSFIFALLSLFVVGGLVTERYGGNFVRYGSLQVDCDVVQPESVCEDFGPWYRNRENIRQKPAEALYGNPLSYTQHWISKTMRGFFVPFSHTPTQVIWEREPFGPIVVKAILPVGFVFACAALIAGLAAVAIKSRSIVRDKPLRFALIICAVYYVVLLIYNYMDYLELGEAEAIQARYSYPILLLMLLLMIQSVNKIISNKNAKVWLLVVSVTLYGWGGGIVPWLIRADDTWHWQNSAAQNVNQKTQAVLKALIIH